MLSFDIVAADMLDWQLELEDGLAKLASCIAGTNAFLAFSGSTQTTKKAKVSKAALRKEAESNRAFYRACAELEVLGVALPRPFKQHKFILLVSTLRDARETEKFLAALVSKKRRRAR